jgi:DNA-binding response OmpR family regulator
MALILIVDDEVNSARLVSMAVAMMGHESVEAYNGDDAVEVIAKNRPDLVILDYMMPGKNGLETLKDIREEFGGAPPVYVLTAAQDLYLKEKVLHSGANGCFTKPINLETLETVISGNGSVSLT